MLFVLNPSSRRGFWMKGMKFPIDVIWLNENKEIVHIKKSLEPCVSNCPVYYPDRESRYTLGLCILSITKMISKCTI